MDKNDRRKALEDARSSLKAADAEADAARRRVEDAEEAIKREDGITKRDVAKAAWVAPLVMSVNMPGSVFAQSQVSPVDAPTPAPQGTPAPATPAPATPAPATPAPVTPAPVTPAPATPAPATSAPAAL